MYEAWGVKWGLDKPLIVQYGLWIGSAIQGDFGTSLRAGSNAFDVVMQRVPATLQLALSAWVFAFIVGIPLGVLSAVKRGTLWDYVGRIFALFGQALPPFWVGIMMILLFSVKLDWLPAGARGGPSHYVMPAITLGWLAASGNLRIMRSAMLEVLDSEYVKLARAKGVGSWSVVWKHAARNAIIPPLTFAGLILAGFLAGTVVTETVFAWPGLGRLAVDSVLQNDFPVMTGAVLVFTLIYVGVTLVTDLIYAMIDPRIRFS
jgi:peptide/nickel transport system permease protein